MQTENKKEQIHQLINKLNKQNSRYSITFAQLPKKQSYCTWIASYKEYRQKIEEKQIKEV